MGLILDQENPVAEEMATHSSFLAWKIPWTEEPGKQSPWDCKESDKTEHAHTQQHQANFKETKFALECWVAHSINEETLEVL